MEAQEEVIVMGPGSKENALIVKGKRTKRQRPQSPIPFAMITANSPTGEGGGGGGLEGEKKCNIDTDTVNDDDTSFSPASSTELLQDSTTEEEEDMANCLILLAQGHTRPKTPKQVEEDRRGGGGDGYKFNSRRVLEAASPGTGKAGYSVYECKTCKRTFPSFQALGGHMASHKKPKAMAAAEEREKSSKQFLLSSDDDQEAQSKKNDLISSLSLQLSSSSRGLGGNNNRSKVHECSICGAEFTSGQALGGHMRRHRAPNMGTNTTLSFTSPSLAVEPDHHDQETKKPRQMLSLTLDLNLPAPEDDHREPKFPFATKQQQQQQQQQQPQPQQPPLVFSARTLVDCHY